MRDEKGDFVYSCYLISPYLDENVRPERTAFEIPESASNDGDGDTDPTMSASGERLRRVMGAHCPVRVSGLDADLEPAPAAPSPDGVRATLQRRLGLTGAWTCNHPTRRARSAD